MPPAYAGHFCAALTADPEQILYGIVMLVVETVVLDKVMLLGQSQIQIFCALILCC